MGFAGRSGDLPQEIGHFQAGLSRSLSSQPLSRIGRVSPFNPCLSGRDMFAHEKLHVYSKSLTFVSGAFSMTEAWEKKHAIKDHFNRASESLVLTLADGARHRSAPTS